MARQTGVALVLAVLVSPALAGDVVPKAHDPLPRTQQLPSHDAPERVLSQLMWEVSERAPAALRARDT